VLKTQNRTSSSDVAEARNQVDPILCLTVFKSWLLWFCLAQYFVHVHVRIFDLFKSFFCVTFEFIEVILCVHAIYFT